MSPIRVVLATLPPLLSDIVRETLVRGAEAEILAEVEGTGELASVLQRTNPDVAVVGVASNDWVDSSGLLRELLVEHPRLTIVALASDGRSGYVYQNQPRGVVINDLSPKSLVNAIRLTTASGVNPPIHPFSAE